MHVTLDDGDYQISWAEANITCEEGDLIRHNHNCTPVCEDGFTASIDAILCEDGRVVWKSMAFLEQKSC